MTGSGFVPICPALTEHSVQIAPSTYWAKYAESVSPAELDGAQAANALSNWGFYGGVQCQSRCAAPTTVLSDDKDEWASAATSPKAG